MNNQKLPFLSLLLSILALAPSMAHLLELYHKLQLPKHEYAVVQQIYDGWALLGLLQIGAAVAIFIQLLHEKGPTFRYTLAALICSAIMLLIFFSFTFPANRATANWTHLPANWEQLRQQWEYSHAAIALFGLIAVISLLLSFLQPRPSHPSIS